MAESRWNPTLLEILKEILTVFHRNNLYLAFKGLFCEEKKCKILYQAIDI